MSELLYADGHIWLQMNGSLLNFGGLENRKD